MREIQISRTYIPLGADILRLARVERSLISALLKADAGDKPMCVLVQLL